MKEPIVAMNSPSVEVDRRRPVWAALSALFLDTELQPEDHASIARVLVASGYSVDELETILRREVGPIVAVNMLSTAGVWEGFDEDWLAEQILRRQRSWRRWLPSFSGFGRVRYHWERIRTLVLTANAG